MKRLTTLIAVFVTIAFTSNAQVLRSTTSTVVATEEWYEIMDNDSSNHFSHIFEKDSEGVITATVKSWQYIYEGDVVMGPITIIDSIARTGLVTVNGTNLSFSVQGTAIITSPSTVAGDTSPYTLSITSLVGNHDTASGTFIMSFTNTNWPSTLQGTWTGTRISGSGITDELTGIDNIPIDKQVILYPNPASDIVTLNIDNRNNDYLTLNIYNVTGTLVKSEMLKQNNRQINIGDLSNGVYMITIKSKDLTLNQRLIIQR